MRIHIARHGTRLGDYDIEEAKTRLRLGSLKANDLAWYEGASDWMPITEVPGFQGLGHSATLSPGLASAGRSELPVASSDYAGFWLRLVALLMDELILLIPKSLVEVVTFSATSSDQGPAKLLLELFFLGLDWVYFATLESSPWQATIGKKALGLRVCDLEGQRISFAKASGRFFGKLLSALVLCLGFLMVAFTKKKQGLHDIMAGTIVTRG